ncbi:MAG: YitT family protein [Mogibacterium sp.]|nr:YitT family protein [Mogibacterium sp.]
MELRITRKNVFEFAQMIAGNAICAFSMACFALPYDMVVSGVSGIGRMLKESMGISITLSVAVINIVFFLLGALLLGRKFAASTAIGTFAYPFFLGVFQNIEVLQHLVDDPLLAAICAGVLDGVGLGLVIRIGGSTGGIDIPAIILNRKFSLKTGTVMSAFDIMIFLIQIPFTRTNGIILGILYALIYSVVMNRMILLEQGGIQLMIWTDNLPAVNEKLLSMDMGTTLLKARGGYMREPKEVIYCAASNRNLNRIKKAVLGIDPKAFITITSMNEINGNGFTWDFGNEVYVPELEDRIDGHELEQSLAEPETAN